MVIPTTIPAMAAVLMLVFKDTILGFVASIQLSSNNMVNLGDWISMPKYNADGDVIDISLNTVKVQNWDKTIATIPTYALVSESFNNWKGMEQSGGRRIKRAVNIDMSSVAFLDDEQIERLGKFYLLNDYISRKAKEIKEYNTIQLKQCREIKFSNGGHMFAAAVGQGMDERFYGGLKRLGAVAGALLTETQQHEAHHNGRRFHQGHGGHHVSGEDVAQGF